MIVGRSKRRSLLALTFIVKSISKKIVDSYEIIDMVKVSFAWLNRATGARNDCFLLNALKTLFRLSRVLLDL